jgi:rRNA maturation endonuclease Nob1
MLFTSFAIFVILGSRHDKATNRRAAGQCVGCGYDVRASKDRCPECGQAIDLKD